MKVGNRSHIRIIQVRTEDVLSIFEFRRNLRREKSFEPSEWSMTFYGTGNLKVLVGYNFVRSENRDKI